MNIFLKVLLTTSLLYLISPAFGEQKKTKSIQKTKELRWLSKTDQFVIYQDRQITKRQKHLYSLILGKHQLNNVTDNSDFGFDYRFYSKESFGLGAYFIINSSSLNEDLELRSDSEYIFQNSTKFQYGLSFDWTPLYGKHLYKRKVIYTDAGVSFSLGMSKTENNNKVVELIDNTQGLTSLSSFDLSVEPFFRFFVENKYFFKFGYKLRSTSIQSANIPGQASAGTGRTFVNQLALGVGIKM